MYLVFCPWTHCRHPPGSLGRPRHWAVSRWNGRHFHRGSSSRGPRCAFLSLVWRTGRTSGQRTLFPVRVAEQTWGRWVLFAGVKYPSCFCSADGRFLFTVPVSRRGVCPGCPKIIMQVLDALVFLHQRGIAHRDIKPENLLLQRRGGEHIKVKRISAFIFELGAFCLCRNSMLDAWVGRFPPTALAQR